MRPIDGDEMSDLISRQAAINAIEFGIKYVKVISEETALLREVNAELEKASDRIKQLPPTQPETDIDDVTCENCRYSERYVNGLILCRRTKTSHRVSATSTCGKGKREVEDAEAKI